MKRNWVLCICVGVISLAGISASECLAQPPIKLPGNDNSKDRRANDNIEGAIYEFTAEVTKGTGEKAKKEKITGRIRIDGTAVFDARKEIELPDVKEKVKGILEGKSNKIKLPEAPASKRIGDISKVNDGRTRIEFKDYEELPGFVIVWQKKERPGVWMGYFQEVKNGKNVERWNFEMRRGED